MPSPVQARPLKKARSAGPAHCRLMPLMLPSESDMESHKSSSIDDGIASREHNNDCSVLKGKRRLEHTLSFYPGHGDNSHVLTHPDCQNFAFHTPEVDDDGSDTEAYSTEDKHAVELALRNSTKFSESMVIERPSWVGSGGTKTDTSASQGSKASIDNTDRSTMGQDTGPSSFAQASLNTGVPTQLSDTVNQLPSWPVETELVFTMGTNILMLTIQRPLVRTVIQDAIENLCAALLFTNAFPGVCVALTLIKDCLFTAADNHKPGAKSILERLTRDQEYLLTVTPLPRTWICLIRGEVKEHCNVITMGAFLAFSSALDIVEYVWTQLSKYTYTFPNARMANAPNELVMHSWPYWNDRIITVIQDMYFSGGITSFAKHFRHLFPTYESCEGVTNYKVPIPMVALVATALYAALYEWRTGEQQVTEFSTNAYLDVYHGHINTLNHIREKREGAFHFMMADIYTQANTSTGNEASPGVLIADLNLDELDG